MFLWAIFLVPSKVASADEFRVSLSVSPFTEYMFDRGYTFTDGKLSATNAEELQRMFIAHGATEIYTRVNTRRERIRGNGDHSIERALDRARLAKKLDIPLNPELGLFGNYGDIRFQPPPDFTDYPEIAPNREWTDLTLDEMCDTLRAYGASIAKEILATGVTVNYWDVGNEIEFGVAGVAIRPAKALAERTGYKPPDKVDPEIGKMSFETLGKLKEPEQIAWFETHLWPHMAKLFAATVDGIRSVDPKARFSTHLSGVAAPRKKFSLAFWRSMKKHGYLPDELGVSFYPTNSGNPPNRLEQFKETTAALTKEFNRKLFVAEYSYPAATMHGIYAWNNIVDGYPQTVEGQSNFLRDLARWGAETGHLSGVRPWAPDFAGMWTPMSLFDAEGKLLTARPGLSAMQEGVNLARQEALPKKPLLSTPRKSKPRTMP